MKKLKDILMGKGVYLIAIVCVVLVCTVGLYISNLDSKRDENDPQHNASSQTDGDRDVLANPQDNKTPSPARTPSLGTTTTPGATATPSQSPSTSKGPETIKMIMPLDGEVLVDYAMDKLVYSKTLEEWRTHSGIDIKGEFGQEVKAAADGKVIDVKKDPRLGYLVILEHSNGVKTVYANLKEEFPVEIGQNVKQGDVVGYIGRSAPFESKEDTHLHFEVLYNDNCVNVWNYLPER